MSRIYFHSPSGTAELRGSERAHMKVLLSNLALAVFDPGGYGMKDVLGRITRGGDFGYSGGVGSFARDFALWFSVGGEDDYFTVGEERYDVFTVALNTGLALGGDPLRLFARLHGQCELHAWVDGPNRAWLANIITEGRASGIMRPDQGWEGIATFLRERDYEPVVTSFSGTDSFPNRHTAEWNDDRDGDGFYDLNPAQQWRVAFAGLKRQGHGLEMRPDHWKWGDYHFGHGQTAFSLMDAAYALAPAPDEHEARVTTPTHYPLLGKR